MIKLLFLFFVSTLSQVPPPFLVGKHNIVAKVWFLQNSTKRDPSALSQAEKQVVMPIYGTEGISSWRWEETRSHRDKGCDAREHGMGKEKWSAQFAFMWHAFEADSNTWGSNPFFSLYLNIKAQWYSWSSKTLHAESHACSCVFFHEYFCLSLYREKKNICHLHSLSFFLHLAGKQTHLTWVSFAKTED